ncbi:uncharacterized protein [Montipora foliosa]|uniref:uncharacterized protein n=1 Tax=Montipora foliosa TaxID=591990 RepID=UPI0035F14560
MTTVNDHEINEQLGEANQKILSAFSTYQKEGSGWTLSEILHLDLNVAQNKPLKGSSYLPLPKKLKDKKAFINVENGDNKCFMWSVLAALHPIPRKSNPERIHHYRPYVDEVNLDGIECPVPVSKIPKFEKKNKTSVNLFGFEEGDLFPLYLTKEREFPVHVNLLLFSRGEKRHYCLIKNLNRLLSNQTRHKAQMYYCLHGFVREQLLEDHKPHCSQHGPQRIRLPNEDNMFLQFKDFQKRLRVPFIIYASPDLSKSSTEKFQKHRACGFAYVIFSPKPEYCKPPVVYCGADAVGKFLEALQQEEERIHTLVKEIVPMQLTPSEEQEFQQATYGHVFCREELGVDRVQDHCHLTGKFRGAAHNACNLNFQFKGLIPIILHNLRGYDSHLIMQGAGKFKNKTINCIPNNMEKYISISISRLDLDSLQFMTASLEKLVSNLAKEGDAKFHVLNRYIEASKVPLLLRKGVYPFDYMDDMSKFQERQLPSKEAFFSQLTEEHISDEDYQHAQIVFTSFQLQTLGEYHDLYLLSDVLLLADVFENFRSVCLNYYGLDPAHCYTSPGLAWSACLKMTDVELELLTDLDMYLFVEEGIRGGISMISNRYGKTNNPYVPGYDSTQDKNYIMYLDDNNLYGWAMSQPLPKNEFFCLTEHEIEELNVMSIPDDGEEGYILEVDIEYPKELHDLNSDYP